MVCPPSPDHLRYTDAGCRIDTQDVLLEQQKTERLIEIGPSATLTVMAKRTLKSQYAAKDAALSTKRQLLSGDADLAEIYYEVAPLSEVAPSSESVPPPPYTAAEPERPLETPQAAPTRSNPISQKKPDASVSALEIIVAIVAQKLKKTTDEISAASTIKSLVAGMPSNPLICIPS
jgi:fatty acid synthase subunit alpha